MNNRMLNAAVGGISELLDQALAQRHPEALLWIRVGKIQEEAGEVIRALIGYTSANPRKGRTHDLDDLEEELLDVAVTALGAYVHTSGTDDPIEALRRRAVAVYERLRDELELLEPEPAP